MWPALFTAFSIAAHPPKTIKSAIETTFFLLSKFFFIISNLFKTFDNSEGLFTSQFFCGSSLILAPLAPPLLSEPLKVDADAQAVETN